MTNESIGEIFDSIVENLRFLDEKKKRIPQKAIISTLYGDKYLVAGRILNDCIKENYLIFRAYYKNDEIPEKDEKSDEKLFEYGVALPIATIASIQIHRELPKVFANEYTEIKSKVGFGKVTKKRMKKG